MAELRHEADKESERLRKKTKELRYKTHLTEITMALRQFPEHAVSVRDHLSNLGVDFDSLENNVEVVSEHLAQAVQPPVDDGAKSEATDVSGASSAYDANGAERCDPLPTCYNEVGLLSVVCMKFYLKLVEPAVFSDHAVKALAPPAKKAIPKKLLQDIWEYIFGEAPTDGIAPSMHKRNAYGEHLKALNISRGRLARDISWMGARSCLVWLMWHVFLEIVLLF